MSLKNKGLRTCLYSNKQYTRQEMIRFVKRGNVLIIDKQKNMPGRGFWLKPTKQAFDDPKLPTILSKRTKCSINIEQIKETIAYGAKK